MDDTTPRLKNYTPLSDKVLEEHGLIVAAVFGRMWRYSQMTDGVCKASKRKIASDLDISERSVIRAQKSLLKAGYITDSTPDRRNAPHEYKVNWYDTESYQNGQGMTQSHSGYDTESQQTPKRYDTESHEESINTKRDSKKQTKKKPIPPAVEAAREVSKAYPHKALWETIDKRVGRNEEDVSFWQEVIVAYIAKGWNPTNYGTMLEFYQRREIPGGGNTDNNGHKQASCPDDLKPVYMPTVFEEELEHGH